jgi:hypothetical protein
MTSIELQRQSWKRHLRYLERVQKNPHSASFKRFLLAVWELLHDMNACSLCWPWWASKYNCRHTPFAEVSQAQLEEWAAGDPAVASYSWKVAAQPTKEALLSQTFLAEYHTIVWLLTQNTKGIAVPSPALLRFYLEQWPRPASSAECYEHLQRIQRQHYARKWLHAFRNRWNVMWRRIPARSPLPPDEARRKAHPCERRKPAKKNQRNHSWPKTGPKNGPCFGSLLRAS